MQLGAAQLAAGILASASGSGGDQAPISVLYDATTTETIRVRADADTILVRDDVDTILVRAEAAT